MKPSEKRFKQLEKLLRRLRADNRLFDDENPKSVQISRLIKAAKARLMPVYDARAYERRDNEFKRQYAIDTAINCRGL